MQNKIFIIAIIAFLMICFSCKKDEPTVQEYYLIVYNHSSDTVFVAFHCDYKIIAKGKQFDTKIEKSQFDNLWLGEAEENLFIYKQDSVKTYLPQKIYIIPSGSLADKSSPFGSFSTQPEWNGQKFERYFKTFTVTDSTFYASSDTLLTQTCRPCQQK